MLKLYLCLCYCLSSDFNFACFADKIAPKTVFASILKKTSTNTPSSLAASVLTPAAHVVTQATPTKTVLQEDLGRDVVVAITDPRSPKGGPVPSPQDQSVPSGDF